MKDFIAIGDCTADELRELLHLSVQGKQIDKLGGRDKSLPGKTLAMIFEKASLRTRMSFQIAMTDLGGHAVYLKPEDVGIIGDREPAKDMARVLARYVHGIMARTYKHETLIELAKYADVPVINALSDWSHPCQAMADILTMYEHCGDLEGRKIAYIGDGNNVARSLAFACAKFKIKIAIASPRGYELDQRSLDMCNDLMPETAVQLNDGFEAAKDADIIYTDTWVSMGQENEKAERVDDFKKGNFQVNSELLSYAPPRAKVMHCLPAYRGMEITDEVAESDRSVIFDQAENRLHFQRALLKKLLFQNPKAKRR
ncbi:Ornithine carbamoyltransferase [Anaerohalosphaera lusitana]|uniref:Ornithine carbamoyltransferase n=1 Tax=Anaerohalosphaera lusitana TaxID=1936003 RepID=A0A1U9NRG6_9BACT|nr:ornithine carbamoyltransferase [Anaerohalosphaera lusitana]AQT70210.1 Ornithine carbamoyltransferase [Anaerohalosphaera lusitana]